jgi:hypothetical protein
VISRPQDCLPHSFNKTFIDYGVLNRNFNYKMSLFTPRLSLSSIHLHVPCLPNSLFLLSQRSNNKQPKLLAQVKLTRKIKQKNQGQIERSKIQKWNLPKPQKYNHSSSAKPFRKTNPRHMEMILKERKRKGTT